jgi:hypothetical protein
MAESSSWEIPLFPAIVKHYIFGQSVVPPGFTTMDFLADTSPTRGSLRRRVM